MCSKLSVHLNGGCSTVGSPAVEMEGSDEPVLVSKQDRGDPGSRAKGEGRGPLGLLHVSGGGREQADLCAVLST